VGLTRDLLDLVMADPPSEARLQEEVALRTILARSLMAVTGYTREVMETMTLAFDLVDESGDAPQRFPVLRNLATLYGRQSNFARAAELGLELVRLADEQDDDAMRCEAHFVVGAYSAFSGDVPTGLEHLARVIDLFDPARATSLEYRIGPISGVLAFTTSAFLRWWQGEPAQGIELMDRALAVARRTEHPFTIAYVLYHVGFFALGRGQMDRVAEVAEELANLADRHDYRIWAALASLLQGLVGVAGGDAAGGLATFERGMAEYEELETPPVFWGMLLTMRGLVHGMAGDLTTGLAMEFEYAAPGDQAVALMTQGDLHASAGDMARAADAYAAAAAASEEAGVVMPQLQAMTRLVALQRAGGTGSVEVEALRAVYAMFDEGFDLPELVEAKRLIDAS
jgi:adenylate cyclase